MLTLLIGTDWIANSEEILQRIAHDVIKQKDRRILIVPELISHDTERRLCAAAGDTVSRFAEVLSFSRLERRAADSLGLLAQECLDDGGRVVAMASAARQLHSKLKAYASVETRPEFLISLVDAIDEFKQCCITSSVLNDASLQLEGSLAQKLDELSLILETYDGICHSGKRDPRDLMTCLLEELETSSFAEDHVFYIDGFPDFTRQHMAILKHLIRESKDVTISLNCDKVNSNSLSYQKAGETAGELLRYAQKLSVPTNVINISPRKDHLTIVREKLFQGIIDKQLTDGSLKLYQTTSVYQECVSAAQRIMTLVKHGIRYRDICVVCTDPAVYNSVIEMVFERCHIPVYLSGTEDILDKSIITTVLSALDTALDGFEKKNVLHYLKSMLSPLNMETCDKIENYAVLWNITGNGWLKEWTFHPDGLGGKWDEESLMELDALNKARVLALTPLAELKKSFSDAENLGQQIKSLYYFLDTIDFSGRLDNLANEFDTLGKNRDAQILNQLWDILLSAMEQLYDVLGHTIWDAETFTRLFKLLLSQYDVGTIPTVLDAVTVGPVNAMRCQRSKHLIILGAQEENFPGYGIASGVLTDQERTALREIGVPLSGGSMNALQAAFSDLYGVFCGAQETITVSCSGGQPSFVFRRLCEIAGSESSVNTEAGIAFADEIEAGAYLARFSANSVAAELNIQDAYKRIIDMSQHVLGSVKPENIQALYGSTLNLSASQIDKQAECRLSYFLKYGLHIKEQKTATIDPAEFGTYVHSVLESTARDIKDRGGFANVTLEEALDIALTYSDQYVKERFSQFDTERMTYLFQRNCKELELIVQELWNELHDSKFEPVDFEVGFGVGEKMPAIFVSAQKMNALLRGFVDRVDTWRNGRNTFFRVVDYKTGKKDFDYCDIYNGIGLQMLLYLFVLEQEGSALLGQNPVPAGVQYFPARVPLLSADSLLTEEDIVAIREKVWKRKGLLLSDVAVLNAMESNLAPNRMPYSLKKDGNFSGDLANERQFCVLKKYIFLLLGKMIDEIASGNIEPNPYTRGSSHDACSFCAYSLICHQEMIKERRNYKAITMQRFWEDIEKEVSSHG